MPKTSICQTSARFRNSKSFFINNMSMAHNLLLCRTGRRPMTLRIERERKDERTELRIIGQIRAEDLDHLKLQMELSEPEIRLDLDEVTIVDAAVIQFLGQCEEGGTRLQNCPLYVREWIKRWRERE